VRKKTRPTGWEALTPFSLYLEDIRDLHDIVSEVCNQITYETDVYTGIANPDELVQIGTRQINELTIIGIKDEHQQLTVRIRGNGASAWATTDSAEMFGAVEKIKRVCWRHAKNFTGSIMWPIWFGMVSYLAFGAYQALKAALWVSGAIVALGLVYALWARAQNKNHYATIYLVSRDDAPSFWGRNRDNIVVGFVLVVAGTVLTILAAAVPIARTVP
jgi:hypothetical protein